MKILGVIFLGILGLLLIFLAASNYAKNEASEAMSNVLSDKIFAKWSYNDLIDNSSSYLLNEMRASNTSEMFAQFHEIFGNIVSTQEPSLTGGYSFQFGDQYSGLYATITYKGIYEKSEADIHVILIKEFSTWKIYSFTVASPILYTSNQ